MPFTPGSRIQDRPQATAPRGILWTLREDTQDGASWPTTGRAGGRVTFRYREDGKSAVPSAASAGPISTLILFAIFRAHWPNQHLRRHNVVFKSALGWF
jgi:hypothetical protein